jgi:hypothetical protein
MGYDLWPRPYRLRSFAGKLMRVSDDLRRCVVFIGFSDGPAEQPFRAEGTVFLISYKQHCYLVTVQHIAAGIGDAPFVIRINRAGRTAENFHVDPVIDQIRWYCNNDDPNVDLALLPFDYKVGI